MILCFVLYKVIVLLQAKTLTKDKKKEAIV